MTKPLFSMSVTVLPHLIHFFFVCILSSDFVFLFFFFFFCWQHAIPLYQQVEYYKEYKRKLIKVAGSKQADTIIKGSIYLLSAGSSDFVQNYYVNPLVNKFYTADQYGSMLIDNFSTFIKVTFYSHFFFVLSWLFSVFNCKEETVNLCGCSKCMRLGQGRSV